MSATCETCRWWRGRARHVLIPGCEKRGLCMNPFNDTHSYNVVRGGAVRMLRESETHLSCEEHEPKKAKEPAP